MTREQAHIVLELDTSVPYALQSEVRKAYARAVMRDHPDHGGTGTRLATLQAARDTLLSHSDISPCILCKGSGKVRGRFGAQTCTACGGSGDRP